MIHILFIMISFSIYFSKFGGLHYYTIQSAERYLTMLLDFNKMGALMRHVMTSALTNPQKYKSLVDPTVSTGRPEYDIYLKESNKIYQDALKSLPNPEPPDEYKGRLVHVLLVYIINFYVHSYKRINYL